MEKLPLPGIYAKANESALFMRNTVPEELKTPKVAIVCGSGLGGLVDTLEAQPRIEISYSDIPNFPQTTVQGHAGKIVFGQLGAKKLPVVLLVGRAHFYEGHSMSLVTFATRVCRVLGITTMIVTNAAGGLNPSYSVGDIVMLNDHIFLAGFTGDHPLRGPNESEFGVRFPALSDAYDLSLRRHTHKVWNELFPASHVRKLHEGIYAFLSGPTYETRAECRLLRAMGADLVGMSTVPEIIVARHCGMRVLGFSLCTNNAVLETGPRGDDPAIQQLSEQELQEYLTRGKANHEEVLQAGIDAAKDMQSLVKKIVEDLHTS